MNEPINTGSSDWQTVRAEATSQIEHFTGVLIDPECTDKQAGVARGVIMAMRSILNLANPTPQVDTINDET
jgi:hypothetical protein